ncbi:MAG: UDP-N-acetylmuramoyl-tripeptide--D-alanyl-D-alanine ligase [Fimbriimonadales bacterium]|nr:UDP-N-acetylmuramoyl-tripeptide--D-alanyl-D-alanine ligase [Fimbriimonadales bacterium]
MRPIAARLLGDITGAVPHDLAPDTEATGFAWNSRQVRPGDVFLCIRGERVDGHDFAAQAVGAGAAFALAERPVSVPHLLVPNVVGAVARIGLAFRDRFQGRVVGVTGSNGKTSTKEFLAAALSVRGPVLKTVGNRNTEIASPLVWTEAESDMTHAVIEMAMRGFGQIRQLAMIARPHVGVVTNIGWSHLEMVGSREGIAKAKSELLEVLPEDGIAVLWREDPFQPQLRAASPAPVRTFGFSEGSDCRLLQVEPDGLEACRVQGACFGRRFSGRVPAAGRHMALNAAASVLVAALEGVDPQDAIDAIAAVRLPPMRMEVRQWRGATLLLDAYNSSPTSLSAALEVLQSAPCGGRRWAVVGEMRELGEYSATAHREALQDLRRRNLHGWCLVGEAFAGFRGELGQEGAFAADASEAREFLRRLQPGDVCLVKGSRALELERALEGEPE